MEQIIYSLSDDNIEFIREDVRKCCLTLPNLEEELIDHICCMVEEKLAEGYSFDKAYQKVRKNVGIDSLKDIEIKAILLIEQKIQAMKTTLKITGISGLIILILASTFKIMHWPGAGVFIFLGFLILSFGYIPFLILTIKKENILRNKLGLAYSGILAAFTVLTSILFTIMHWPFQQYLVYISWITILLFLILLFNHSMKSDENRVLNLSVILFFTVLFVSNIAMYWVNLKNPKMTHYTLERDFEKCTAIFVQKSNLFYLQSDTINDLKIHNEIAVFRAKTDSIIDQINTLKGHLFANEQEKDTYLRHIIKKDIKDQVEEEAMKLERDLSTYRQLVVMETSLSSELNSFIETNMQFSKHDFSNPPPVVYNNLSRLIRDIRIIESELLSEKISD